MKEFEFIKSLQSTTSPKSPQGIGDDAALLGDKYLIAKDILVENIHFLKTDHIDNIIFKLFTCNVSDIAAMGGTAKTCLLGIACHDEGLLTHISEAVLKCSSFYGVDIIGGDTSKSLNGLFLSMTIIGDRNKNILTRSGAKPGNIIYISRPIGLARLSLEKHLGLNNFDIDECYHYRLKAETKVGEFLGNFDGITCCCDISDGLGRDINNIAISSGVKASLDISGIDLSYLEKYTHDKEEYFLSSGEEFALLFGVDKKYINGLENEFYSRFGYKPLKIGIFEEGNGCFVLKDGIWKDISSLGFEHFKE